MCLRARPVVRWQTDGVPPTIAFADPPGAPPDGVRVGDEQRYGHAWIATGEGWQPIVLAPGEAVNGFAMTYRNGFGALYAAAGTVWLQFGARGWNCADLVEVVQQSDRADASSYRLTFVSGAAVDIELVMPEDVAWQRRVDPTYDAIDAMADDLLTLLPFSLPAGVGARPFDWLAGGAEPVATWRTRVARSWAAGVGHGPQAVSE